MIAYVFTGESDGSGDPTIAFFSLAALPLEDFAERVSAFLTYAENAAQSFKSVRYGLVEHGQIIGLSAGVTNA